jgi:hypothetical protein
MERVEWMEAKMVDASNTLQIFERHFEHFADLLPRSFT